MKILGFLYGVASYVVFLAVFLYAIAFVGDLPVPKTINITVDYLRSARVIDTHARATITKHGRRVANVQVRAWQADESKPVAAAHAHFLLKTMEAPENVGESGD